MTKKKCSKLLVLLCFLAVLCLTCASCSQFLDGIAAPVSSEMPSVPETTERLETPFVTDDITTPEISYTTEVTPAPEVITSHEITTAPEEIPFPEATTAPDEATVPEATTAPETDTESETSTAAESPTEPETPPESDSEPPVDTCEHTYAVVFERQNDCTIDGFTVYECTLCGTQLIDNVIEATGHSYGDWITVTAPEIGKSGLDKKVCSACGHEHTRSTSVGEPIEVRDGNISYGYYSLAGLEYGEELQAFYRDMLLAAEEFAHSDRDITADEENKYVIEYIDLSGYKAPPIVLATAWKIFIESNPAYYWLSNHILIQKNKLYFSIDEAYATYEARRQCDEAIAEMAQEALSLISDTDSDLEIAIKLHDYLTEKMTYAYVEGTRISEDSIWAHNIVGSAMYGKGVCEAYTKSYLYLCTLGGLECLFVSGFAGEAHAWNYVKLHDEWYAVDVTWDDGGSRYSKYKYFGLSEESISLDHTHDNPESEGLYFLYELPETAGENLCPVLLYEDGMLLDTFKTPETAFEAMTDAPGEYTMVFLMNDVVLKSDVIPTVKSIIFVGMNEEIDAEHFYGSSTLSFAESVTFGGNVTFRNVCVSGSLHIGEFTLTTEGIYCRISGSVTGDEGALISIQTTYKTDIDAETSVRTENK